MERQHSSYNNLKNWKEQTSDDTYAIVPSPNGAFLQLMICLPAAGVFYWLLHYRLDIPDSKTLLIADVILMGTSVLMLFIFLYQRCQTMRDARPYLIYTLSKKELHFPRHEKRYRLKGAPQFFISHDFFNRSGDNFYSELNLIEPVEDGENCFPLLHHLGRYRKYDRIGKKLEQLGIPYIYREEK